MSEPKEINYWKLQKEEFLRELNTSEKGLDDTEAARRLEEYGLNEIPSAGRRTSFSMFVSQFKNPLVYVLIFASALAGFLGEITEAVIIIVIMLANALLGFIQERKSERAVDELRKYLSYTAMAVRKGRKIAIDTSKLVPGDFVHLAIGDVVPADIRLLDADEFQTDESVLTGESTPVDKDTTPVELDNPLPHQLSNIALMGSTVTNGSGVGVVAATGRKTYFGHVASKLSLLPPMTDFQKNIAGFGNFLVKVILLLTVFVFLVNSVLGHGVFESLIFSLALAVGIIPEALPVVITVGLSDGAIRLVKKNVVVKRLEAIENMGNIDVLCTDKTGTLTQNKIKVEDIVDPNGTSDLRLIKFALLCNTAVVEGDRILGNPIDVAIWGYAREKKFDEAGLNAFTRVHEIPFGFNRRRMSVVVEISDRRLLITKGAPESILGVSTAVGNEIENQPISQATMDLNALIEKYRQAGNRLIALACKTIEKKLDYSVADEGGLTFVGLLFLSDPPKEDSAPAISQLKSLGIKLKILSGDDPVVTADVCRRLGIDFEGRVLTGVDIENMQEGELRQAVEGNDVFGRVTPEQKYAIVDALRKNGHVTGFLGDGVNDAPALKLADVGISVDSGVQVAKEAASIILLEKSLGVIADGVAEGRKAFGNMTKYIMNTISANLGNMFTLAVGSLFLPFIPLLPSQILLTNLLSDAPLLTISTDRLDEEGLRAPKRWNIGLIAKFALFFGLISSIFDFVTISSLVYLLHAGPELFRTGWLIESVMSEILVTFSIRTRRKFFKSRPSNLLIVASVIMASTTLFIVYSPIGLFFEFVKPPLWFLGLIFGVLICYFLFVEGLKHLFFSRYEV
ncbi:MAG: magnesium-translocating P-type ATPase [Candidatus Bathyarchaeota archaeon]|nr:magnesium-translocating P-type ATPase [Candidatus Bathyarchaeota archaeon]MDH5623712.1 magnesium-translocating P-type ATPase [Candidatus Bathyarchaeota archaeon]MDH5636184.1 magnesium-translocating P-type ATPase [Candidatus Bathyarchaeota archaeon]MDH5702386.1 magnesium-translocating P-type ATPase [Candidatus Bathyarchaeota archaeon]